MMPLPSRAFILETPAFPSLYGPFNKGSWSARDLPEAHEVPWMLFRDLSGLQLFWRWPACIQKTLLNRARQISPSAAGSHVWTYCGTGMPALLSKLTFKARRRHCLWGSKFIVKWCLEKTWGKFLSMEVVFVFGFYYYIFSILNLQKARHSAHTIISIFGWVGAVGLKKKRKEKNIWVFKFQSDLGYIVSSTRAGRWLRR